LNATSDDLPGFDFLDDFSGSALVKCCQDVAEMLIAGSIDDY
jgi:hypothetical protein